MSSGNGLPDGWTVAAIKEIATTATGGTPSRLRSDYFGGDVPWVKSGELGDGIVRSAEETLTQLGVAESNAKVFPKGTLCIALYGATVGKLGILGMDAATNQAVCGIFLRDEIDTKYVFHFLASIRRELIQMGKGGAQSNISNGIVRETRIPLAPLAEQRRIVGRIEELFSDLEAGVAALERARGNLKRYRASVLKAAVEGSLTANWRAQRRRAGDVSPPVRHEDNGPFPDRGANAAPLASANDEPAAKLLERILQERRRQWEADQLAKFTTAGKPPPKNWQAKYAEPAPPDTTNLSALPDGWCWATLRQLLRGIEGGKSFKCLTRPATSEEWGVVKVSAMTWGTFLEEEQKAIPPDASFDPQNEVQPGDLLLSRCNTTELVGATVLVGPCRPRLLLSDKSLRLLASDQLDRRWLHRALSSSIARRQLSAMATGTSDSMRNVSQEKIDSVVLPLPPLAEQQQIVAEVAEKLSQIEAAEVAIEHGLRRAARLRQSILKQAFAGKLVPQDPTDEPASTLLVRLQNGPTPREICGKAPVKRKVKADKRPE